MQLAAKQRFADAQYALGLFYSDSGFSGKNEKTAFNWMKLAAEQGHIQALMMLGSMYKKGIGVPGSEIDFEKSFLSFKKAAEEGDSDAMIELAWCYYNGRGVAFDHHKAFKLWEKAAKQGNNKAEHILDQIRRMSPDYIEAKRILLEAMVISRALSI